MNYQLPDSLVFATKVKQSENGPGYAHAVKVIHMLSVANSKYKKLIENKFQHEE